MSFIRIQKYCPHIALCLRRIFLLSCLFAGIAGADESVPPHLSEPLQKEQFFEPERFSFTESSDSKEAIIQPHLSVSHDKREDDVGLGVRQKSERVHGEAGGKLNLLGDISLTTFAKVPVYSKETIEHERSAADESRGEVLKNPGQLSWRSELGVPVKKGVDLNFFYDNSSLGKIDKPGVEEREEKFGTRFIFKFK
jgi:hypothetical protein